MSPPAEWEGVEIVTWMGSEVVARERLRIDGAVAVQEGGCGGA